MRIAVAETSARSIRGAPVHGEIDVVEPNGTIRGWCAATLPPFGPRRVSVLLGNTPALIGLPCDVFRDDLLLAGVGDGRHGFCADLPPDLIVPGRMDLVRLIDEDTGTPVGEATQVRWAGAAIPPPALQSYIDGIHADGLVAGWCWDPADPDRRVVLDVLANGIHAGTTVAGLFREDLLAAGKGSGRCAFSFFLPWNLIATSARVDVILQDSQTGLPIGQTVTLRRPLLVSAERRIDSLERQLKLLQGELKAAEARQEAAEDARNTSDLFRLVASFFQDLADGKPRGPMIGLKARLEETASRFPLVPLAMPSNPVATILLLPDGRIDRLHACCAALHRAGADLSARIIVLESQHLELDDVTLIHAAVRNLQTHRIRPDETINDALGAIDTPYVALLPAQIAVAWGWLDRLVALLEADQGLAIATGALSLAGDPPVPLLLAADATNGLQLAQDDQADAVDSLGIVLRRQSLVSLGGLDLSFEGLASQILDLCLRLRASGLRIGTDKEALGYTADTLAPLLDEAGVEDLRRLRIACSALAASREAASRRADAQPAPSIPVRRAGRVNKLAG